jgi:hypothetical protein
MKIPSTIKLGGHTIRVLLVDTSMLSDRGDYSNYHNLIRLQKEDDTPDDNLAECLLHEIIEAIKFKNNLSIEHTELSVLSECLYQVFVDNDMEFLVCRGEK